MDRPTVEVYDDHASEWVTARRPVGVTAAEDLGRRAVKRALSPGVDLQTRPLVADLGCGPGWHLDALGHSGALVVGVDASGPMTRLARQASTAGVVVQADLEALPFRRGALAGAWARNSYVHLARPALPEALADLHRVMRVGGVVAFTLFGDQAARPDEQGCFPDDDFPGRFFSAWSPEVVADIMVGAGFDLESLDSRPSGDGGQVLTVQAVRARTLPDRVGPGMHLLLCGLNPSLYSADAGFGFARPGNRFWPAATAAGLVDRALDATHALRRHHLGMTDLVKRATPGAAELRPDEFAAGLARVDRLVRWLQPAAICVLGLAGWRAARDRRATAGVQPADLGGRPVYLMPNPSGLNAHATVASLAAHLQAASALASRAQT